LTKPIIVPTELTIVKNVRAPPPTEPTIVKNVRAPSPLLPLIKPILPGVVAPLTILPGVVAPLTISLPINTILQDPSLVVSQKQTMDTKHTFPVVEDKKIDEKKDDKVDEQKGLLNEGVVVKMVEKIEGPKKSGFFTRIKNFIADQ